MNPRQKTQPTFVFVHGFLDDAAIWRPLITALHTPDSQSRAVDLAGMSGAPARRRALHPGPLRQRRDRRDRRTQRTGRAGWAQHRHPDR